MKVAVLGGAGLTGSCAVRALAEAKEVDEGIVADLDGEKAQSVRFPRKREVRWLGG